MYLTYPFVLSWSLLEAMSVGCAVVASETAPVQEVIQDGKHGLLFNFFDSEALVDKVCKVLETPEEFLEMRHEARSQVLARYDLASVCLPQWLALLTQ